LYSCHVLLLLGGIHSIEVYDISEILLFKADC